MKTVVRASLVPTLVVCLGLAPAPPAIGESSVAARGEALVRDLKNLWEAPAVSAAVAVDGEVVFSAAAGMADAEGAPADATTRFRIASVSKPISGVLALRLSDLGQLDLDAPLGDLLPQLPETARRITVRQLLTHTAGIRHYRRGETSHKIEHFDSPLAALDTVLSEPLLFEPGTSYLYTTYGYTLLQAAIEAATGASFETALQRHVLEPSGMSRTALDRVGKEGSRATGFDRSGPVAADDVSFKYAGGGMAATPSDLVRLCAALDRGDLLAAGTREALLRPARPELDPKQSYGFAVEREITSGLLRLWHPGRGNGFEAYLLCYPEERVGVAVATNQDWTDPWNQVGRAAETLARLYLPAIHLYRTPPQVLVARLEEASGSGESGLVAEIYADYRRQAEEAWSAGLEVHRLGEKLTREGSLEAAGAIFAANVEAFPESWHTQLALAEARQRLGDLTGAASALESARPLVPDAEVLAELAARLQDLSAPSLSAPEGRYRLSLRDTGIAERLEMTLEVAREDARLVATARADDLGPLPVVAVQAGGGRLWLALKSPYGLVEMDLLRSDDGVAGSWRLGFESGPLEGRSEQGSEGEPDAAARPTATRSR